MTKGVTTPSAQRVFAGQGYGMPFASARRHPNATLRGTTDDVEVISFPGGGTGCYDSLFIPAELVVDLGLGRPFTTPVVLRVTQRNAGTSWLPFIGPEVLGLRPDDSLPCPRMRGRVRDDGWVPPEQAPRDRSRIGLLREDVDHDE